MFNPLGFASSAAIEAAATVVCGCSCTGSVGVLVDGLIIEVEVY